MQLTAEYLRAGQVGRDETLELVIALLYLVKGLLRLLLLPKEEGGELDPLRLTERGGLLVPEEGEERDVQLLESIIPSALEGGDEDQVRLQCHDQLGVKVSLYPDPPRLALRQSVEHLLIEEEVGTRHTDDPVDGIELDEIGELQRRHHDHPPHRHLYRRVALGDLPAGIGPSGD